MKCQILFSGKNKKNIFNLLSESGKGYLDTCIKLDKYYHIYPK